MSIFDTIRVRKPKKTNFDLSHEVKLTTNFGTLTPIFCQDVVPGDRFKMSSEVFIRLAPMIAPVMHRVDCYVHFFFVPYRLLWKNWEEFITGGPDGTSNPVFPSFKLHPSGSNSTLDHILASHFGNGSLADYLGVPDVTQLLKTNGLWRISQLPFRAYQTIYQSYYRDQNLTDEIDYKDLPDTLDSQNSSHSGAIMDVCVLRQRAWEKDYFTSALPDPQRGPEVLLPIQGEADIIYKQAPDQSNRIYAVNGVPVTNLTQIKTGNTNVPTTQDGMPIHWDNSDDLKADLSTATATTINDLRRAMKLQEWLEKNARSGARYVEQILAHFGVRSSDARLQRPEYLGGGVTKVQISDVVQTTQTSSEAGNLEASPQGNLSGYGISVGKSNKFKRFFEEHGIVMGILSIRPRATYQQGLSRHLTKFDRFDYYFPEFAHLGEQEIKLRELYATGTASDETTFGYTPRYAEYKFIPSSVHGEFRSSLNFWHLGRIFKTPPLLNNGFVTVSPSDLSRIFAVEDSQDAKFYCQIYNKLIAKRPMPRFGTPLF
ncbi:major capsid protein [Sigmofec virus UA08Rod_6926]|uniref:Major capsid protein n=1 Tax=Sigmofec virus UA08Rod_6926 TaxID=2929241 RepID=A0A976N0R8_9VIRU|nr:major capsid protein [Sigmofec virus UA08Rod_6926]